MRIAAILAIVLMAGCKDRCCEAERVQAGSFDANLGRAIRQKCGSSAKCIVRLSDLTPFAWDKMYYFDDRPQPSERDRIVGLPVHANEFQRQIVFLDRGAVVDNELLDTNIEAPVEGMVVFFTTGMFERSGWLGCAKAARFEVKQETDGKHAYTVLNPTPETVVITEGTPVTTQ